MDRFTHKVLSWRLSNTMDAEFYIEALQDALKHYGASEFLIRITAHEVPFYRDPARASDQHQHGRAGALTGRTPDEAYHGVRTSSGPGSTPGQRTNSSAVSMAA